MGLAGLGRCSLRWSSHLCRWCLLRWSRNGLLRDERSDLLRRGSSPLDFRPTAFLRGSDPRLGFGAERLPARHCGCQGGGLRGASYLPGRGGVGEECFCQLELSNLLVYLVEYVR
jgi:hypothetical protein